MKEVAKGEDPGAIKSAIEELTQASHRLAEHLYKQTAGAQADAPPPPPGSGPTGDPSQQEPGAKGDDDIIDADFEVKQ